MNEISNAFDRGPRSSSLGVRTVPLAQWVQALVHLTSATRSRSVLDLVPGTLEFFHGRGNASSIRTQEYFNENWLMCQNHPPEGAPA